MATILAKPASDYPLLDQLQTEVSRVLEQTARLLASSNDDNKAAPAAHASKLKKILPECTDRFHSALDQLEEELQLAKAVMRRDLAGCRERAGLAKVSPTEAGVKLDHIVTEEPIKAEADDQTKVENVHQTTEDAMIIDSEPDQPPEAKEPGDEALSANKDPADATRESDAEVTEKSAVEASSEPSAPEASSTDPPLQIDTQAKDKIDQPNQAPEDDDPPPDTGTFSNTNDLDSLFGGPTSAGVDGAPDFTHNDDFDFGSFTNDADNNGADSDNIASLLPGLQDYANTQPSGSNEPDFDALFSTDMPGADGGVGGESQGEHRDSTFDDLMDFADFGTGDFTGAGNGNNENQDFDFSFD